MNKVMSLDYGNKLRKKRNCKKVISIASGKGGVGKTLTTVNLAIAARRMGLRVLILDGDFGLANVDIVLGLQARYNINDIFENEASMNEIILEGPLGIKIIPSGSGIMQLTQLSYLQRILLLEQVEKIDEFFDVMLIDTGAGVSDTVLNLNAISDEILVVTTPEPHSMTDAYAFIKIMTEKYGKKHINLLVNNTRSIDEGLKIASKISEVAKEFLDLEINVMQPVPYDPQVQKSLMMRRAASRDSTYTISGQAWNGVAREVLQDVLDNTFLEKEVGFWRNMLLASDTNSISEQVV